MSGDTASFLAGGEFPVPVAQDSSNAGGGATITVEFKQFGVSLAFTPTVLDDDLINLIVSPEVSSIDRAESVSFGGFQIPGLKTRRATTTVELRDGQSFAIAGLIQSDFSDTVDQFPTLGDTPVLGALLRSSDFRQKETELVIIVTPYLVKPAPAGALATPVESFVPPSEYDLFFRGKIEDSTSGMGGPASGSSAVLNRRTAGGIQGPHGHIIQ